MANAPDHAQRDSLHYRAMRDIIEQMQDDVPGKFEITKEGIVHDMMAPGRPHETTPDGPRYAIRKDFVYGEDVTIGEWTISTDGLPLYA
ncbi:hypothetical protein OG978_23465 [Streptomyces sp. NBC_01591]|uniref:hypothetical protein n=1 Tax=Streptomyces sp. NBC_01591 TaxID=2975888 RepID=UPI002DDAAFFC|nr:hypothetical protein [Streptomyces sp. NBC_01591]WSD70066.1 hypothetical protein OG978_23465 [Streptomyces sp. NBC_01591]